jgi:hypothetical protein
LLQHVCVSASAARLTTFPPPFPPADPNRIHLHAAQCCLDHAFPNILVQTARTAS